MRSAWRSHSSMWACEVPETRAEAEGEGGVQSATCGMGPQRSTEMCAHMQREGGPPTAEHMR